MYRLTAILIALATVLAATQPGVAADKLPRTSELKISPGTEDGFRSPVEVVARAIATARDGKLPDLKALLSPEAAQEADERSLTSRDGHTNLKELSMALAALETEGLRAMPQNTRGSYSVVACRGIGLHMIRLKLHAFEGAAAEGEPPPPATLRWVLANGRPDDLFVDYDCPEARRILEVIGKGDATALKPFLDTWETQGLDLLAGVQEGVDPYNLLARRLQQITATGAPTVLVNRYTPEVAYWYSGEKGSAFVALHYWVESDWQTRKRETKVRLAFNSTAQFHRDAGGNFEAWVDNQDWGSGDK